MNIRSILFFVTLLLFSPKMHVVAEPSASTMQSMQETIVKEQIDKTLPRAEENFYDIQGMDPGALAPSIEQIEVLKKSGDLKQAGLEDGPQRGVPALEAIKNVAEASLPNPDLPLLCNGNGNPPHSIYQYAIPPIRVPVENAALALGPLAPFVYAYAKMCISVKLFAGIPSGICIDITSGDFPCFVKVKVRSLVDYYFPSAIENTSRDPMVSRFLPEQLAKVNQQLLKQFPMYALGQTQLSAIEATKLMTSNVNLANKFMKREETASADPQPNPKALNAIVKVTSKVINLPEGLKMLSPDAEQMYFRSYYNLLNMLTQYIDHIPHVPQANFFGTDLIMGYPYSKIVPLSAIDMARMTKFRLASLLPVQGGIFSCIGNNKLSIPGRNSPRTPLDLLPFVFPQAASSPLDKGLVKNLCTTGIGLSFPFVSQFDGYSSDRTFRALFSGLDLVSVLSSVGAIHGHHLFRKGADMLVVRGDEVLKSEFDNAVRETYQGPARDESAFFSEPCFDDNKALPWDFKEYNSRKLLNTEENWFEHQALFRGCWGEKGKDDWTYIIPLLSTKIKGDKLRLK